MEPWETQVPRRTKDVSQKSQKRGAWCRRKEHTCPQRTWATLRFQSPKDDRKVCSFQREAGRRWKAGSGTEAKLGCRAFQLAKGN